MSQMGIAGMRDAGTEDEEFSTVSAGGPTMCWPHPRSSNPQLAACWGSYHSRELQGPELHQPFYASWGMSCRTLKTAP